MIDLYIYGLDLSIACTGVVIMNESQEIIFIDSIQTQPRHTTGDRLHIIREYFKELRKTYPPTIVCIERGFSRFNKATQVLYSVHGVVLELFHDVECLYFPPTKVKKAVTGKGNANKKEVMDEIKLLYPDTSIKNDDESDAIGVALMYFE